mgnify:CR=1 FL=1
MGVDNLELKFRKACECLGGKTSFDEKTGMTVCETENFNLYTDERGIIEIEPKMDKMKIDFFQIYPKEILLPERLRGKVCLKGRYTEILIDKDSIWVHPYNELDPNISFEAKKLEEVI